MYSVPDKKRMENKFKTHSASGKCHYTWQVTLSSLSWLPSLTVDFLFLAVSILLHLHFKLFTCHSSSITVSEQINLSVSLKDTLSLNVAANGLDQQLMVIMVVMGVVVSLDRAHIQQSKGRYWHL